ncbi:aryl-sulfate sulfotransferase [candidate division KSB1 bacterium]|nr:aryl-sulfate sulfotransferase [candidate division KSB1 bacterium]
MKCISLFVIICLIAIFSGSLFASSYPYQYLSPKPGADYVSPQSKIIIRFQSIRPENITNLCELITVTGSQSGQITGNIHTASDKRTIIFTPASNFLPGETVTVRLNPGNATANLTPFEYPFHVSKTSRTAAPQPENRATILDKKSSVQTIGTPTMYSNGVSVPSDFPAINITVNDNPDSGYIFLNNWGGQPYNVIFNNNGEPIWYLRTPDRRRDFKVQKNGLLTMLVRQGFSFGQGFLGLNENYEMVASYYAANGYNTDEHECQVLADGHYLLIGQRDEPVDMSQYVTGGNPNATVSSTVIQEFTPEGDLIFLWRAWDYFDIRDLQLDNLRGAYMRFPHMNAIDIDDDGNILLSSRHLSEVTKINRHTGDIIWRLGGAHNQFTFVDDPLNGFTSQHDIRSHGNNRYTLFDNGNFHNPPVSRAVEYQLDSLNMTATLVWQFRDTPDKYTSWMGNVQRLPNGNTLIDWADASLPKLTEVRSNGEKAFEMDFVESANCYRLYRFPWHGKALQPTVYAELQYDNVTLIFNQFGDPDVAYYNIYGGRSIHPTTLMDSSKATMKSFSNLEQGRTYFFRVTAVLTDGSESGFSNEERIVANYLTPGDEMVQNGTFSVSSKNWELGVQESAEASGDVNSNGEYQIVILNGGSDYWYIQFRQGDLPLLQGRKYRFEFDAAADIARVIDAKVETDGDPWINYGRIGPTYITRQMQRYSYEFTMQDPSDFAARIVFNVGNSDVDLRLDNISLKEVVDVSSVNNNQVTPVKFRLGQNFPNPFNPQTMIPIYVQQASHVNLCIYNLQGQLVRTLLNANVEAGSHQVRFQADLLPSGLYFCQMDVRSNTERTIYSDSRKLLLLK